VARSSGIKGLVKVNVSIDELGNVTAANVSEGPPVLRQAAEDAAREWKFKPATRNGTPVPSTKIIYFTFEGY
jgi:protein TonB